MSNSYLSVIDRAHRGGQIVLPSGELVSMDGHKTRLNNNVIILGTSGAGKTRSYVIPNILTAVGSYIVTDPKGNLCRRYSRVMQVHGYQVRRINLIHPEQSDGYNPLAYVHSSDDILKLAHQIVYSGYSRHGSGGSYDPFWDRSSEMLLAALIAYLVETKGKDEPCTIQGLIRLIPRINADELYENDHCEMDDCFQRHCRNYQLQTGRISWAWQQYQKFRQTPKRTLNCILVTMHTLIGALDTDSLQKMMSGETLDFTTIGREKTIVFVEISDTDRSKDILANIFYSQAMNALCSYADEWCVDSCLPVPVRFILDDFGTNCRIDGFESMISNIRSRGISASLILQSESQLIAGYADSAHTIMDNCDTMVYMGGNDVQTATMISKRCNKPLRHVLEMPVSTNWTFRRGQPPCFSRTVDLDDYFPDYRRKQDDRVDA